MLVDDHSLFRESLALRLSQEEDLTVCATFDSAQTALPQIRTLQPDLAILDISLEGMGGLELCKILRSEHPEIRILILSMHKELLYAERALAAGANGYLMKERHASELVDAIRAILRGETSVSHTVKEHILQNVGAPLGERGSPVTRLSSREFEVFELIARGYGTRHIATALHLSPKTVETHREHIREKLRIKTSFQLLQYAHDWASAEKPQTG